MVLDQPASVYAWNENRGVGRLVGRVGHGNAVLLVALVFVIVWVVVAVILGAVGTGIGAAAGAVLGLGGDTSYEGMKAGLYVALWTPVAALLYLGWGGLVWAFASHLLPESDGVRGALHRRG